LTALSISPNFSMCNPKIKEGLREENYRLG